MLCASTFTFRCLVIMQQHRCEDEPSFNMDKVLTDHFMYLTLILSAGRLPDTPGNAIQLHHYTMR